MIVTTMFTLGCVFVAGFTGGAMIAMHFAGKSLKKLRDHTKSIDNELEHLLDQIKNPADTISSVSSPFSGKQSPVQMKKLDGTYANAKETEEWFKKEIDRVGYMAFGNLPDYVIVKKESWEAFLKNQGAFVKDMLKK